MTETEKINKNLFQAYLEKTREFRRGDAQRIIVQTERLYKWVKEKLPR